MAVLRSLGRGRYLVGLAGALRGSPAIACLTRFEELRAAQDGVLEAMLRSDDVRDRGRIHHRPRASRLAELVVCGLRRALRMAEAGVDTTALERVLLAAAADVGARGGIDIVGRFCLGSFASRGAATTVLLNTPNADLLRAWDQYENDRVMCAEQVAIGSRLAQDHVSGICLRLLSAVELTLRVVVLDEGEADPPPPQRYWDSVPADCYARRERGSRRLSSTTSREQCGLGHRPGCIADSRVRSADHRREGGGLRLRRLGDADAVRLALLATLLQPNAEESPLPLQRVAYVRWGTNGEFQGAVSSALRQYEILYWSVVNGALRAASFANRKQLDCHRACPHLLRT